MTRILILLAVYLLPMSVFSQTTSCDCPANLAETIKKTELNYAGYPTKVNSKIKSTYNALVKSLTEKATQETNTKKCFYLIKEYVRFFKDKHFSLTYLNPEDPDQETIDPNAVVKELSTGKLNPLEGIWTNPDSTLSLAIREFPDHTFKAIIINAKDEKLTPGLVYFTLTPNARGYLLKQYNVFNSVDFYAQKKGNLLQLWNFALFGKVSGNEITAAERKELANWKNNNNGLEFKLLDSETSYIKIPTFFNNDNKIEKLVNTNDRTIRSSKYLIIDLRGNGGGNSGWSFLLPYVMTNPIKQDDPLLRVSADNIKIKQGELEYVVKNPLPKEMEKYYPQAYLSKLKHIYNDLPVTKQTFYSIPGLTIPLDSTLTSPVRIALITDGLCGSSTEYFFHLMGQSSKTTRYGINTVGMMDFEGPAATTPLPSKQLILMVPVSKMSWTDKNPIDQLGFSPDVKLTIPHNEWVDYIRKDLKKKVK
ncbi:hypothetical protein ACVWYN_002165 [Pedobacter sp. UYP24]